MKIRYCQSSSFAVVLKVTSLFEVRMILIRYAHMNRLLFIVAAPPDVGKRMCAYDETYYQLDLKP